MENIIFGRYQLLERIGMGGSSEVFLADDLQHEQKVVVKVAKLPNQASFNAEKERFFAEASLLSSLNHPGIPKVFDCGFEQDMLYYVMEWAPGTPLSKLKDLDVEKLLVIFKEAAKLIGYIQSRNVIHRDIKPSNFIVLNDPETSTGLRVKLIDFGLAKSIQTLNVTTSGMVLGTLNYMSPEQLQGGMIDMRSDIYAFGATMYFMLTGKLPFSDKNPTKFAYQLLNTSPTPPSELNRKVPKKLDVVVLGLLRKDPNERIQSCSEIHKMLSEIDLAHPEAANQALFIGNAPMVGRENELDYFRQLWNSAKHSCATVVVSGAFGIGKSRLVDEFSSSIQLQAETLLRARGMGQTGSLPLEGLKQLLFNLSHYDLQVDGLPDEVFNAIGNIEPRCAKSQGYTKQFTTVSVREMTSSFVRLISKLSQKKPIAIVLEEAPNIDEISVLACLDLASDPANKIFLILTTDRAPIKNSSSFESAYASVRNKSYIQLEPLGIDSLRRLLSHIFQSDDYPIELANDLMEKYSGNPYLMVGHLQKLVRDGNLSYRNGKIVYKRSITTGSHVFFSEILSNLSDAARHVLDLFALISIPLDNHLIADALNIHKDTVQSALDELKTASLIKDISLDNCVKYSISYPILVKRVEDSIDSDEKKRLHESIARKFEALSADSSNLIEHTAKHHVLSGNLKKSIEWSRKCALHFLRAGMANENEHIEFIEKQAKKLGDLSIKNIADYLRAVQLLVKGEVSQSESLLVKVIRSSQELNDYETYFDAGLDLFEVCGRLNRFDSFERMASDAVLRPEIGLFPDKHYNYVVFLSAIALKNMKRADLVKWTKVALELRKSRNLDKIIHTDLLFLSTLLGSFQVNDAYAFATEALSLPRTQGDIELRSIVTVFMGYCKHLMGDSIKAMQLLTDSLERINSPACMYYKALCFSYIFAIAMQNGDFEFLERYRQEFDSLRKNIEAPAVFGRAYQLLAEIWQHGWKDVYLDASTFQTRHETDSKYPRVFSNLVYGIVILHQGRVREACQYFQNAWHCAFESGSDVMINYCAQLILSQLIPGQKYPKLDSIFAHFSLHGDKTTDFFINNLYFAYAKGLTLLFKTGKNMAEFELMIKLLQQAQEMAIGNEMKTLYASISLSLGYAFDQRRHSKYAAADDSQKSQNMLFTAEFVYNAIGADYMASFVQNAKSEFVFD